MIEKTQSLSPPGEKVKCTNLQSSKGIAFAAYLKKVGKNGYVALMEVRRENDPPSDVIVFSIEPERPQQLKNDIKKVEPMGVMFRDDDGWYPEVLALRHNFPLVPHVNARTEEFPRSLCMYDQPWDEEKLTWTPVNFLQRIQTWLSKTADGTLHGDDQPLEPMLPASNWHLIVPPNFADKTTRQPIQRLVFTNHVNHENGSTLIAKWATEGDQSPQDWVSVTFQCSPKTHGIIRKMPGTLQALHEICRSGDVELLEGLCEIIKEWISEGDIKRYQNSRLILIVLLPKTRTDGGAVEMTESRAFLTENTVREIGIALGIIAATGPSDLPGLVLSPPEPDPIIAANLAVFMMSIHKFINMEMAGIMNGSHSIEKDMIAIGVGAFGSQVLNNMVRAGMGKWTIVDHDIFMPHNCARHLLSAWAVGRSKVEAVAMTLTHCINIDGNPIKTISANVLNPEKHDKELRDAMDGSDVIFDFSASVAVARQLGQKNGSARRISGFVAPSGNGLIILLEDTERNYRLDWLEALHYRAILIHPPLVISLTPKDGRIRTGASCRDISVQLAQADMAMWAGMFSKQITPLLENPTAAVKIFQQQSDDSIIAFSIVSTPVFTRKVENWTIRLDEWLLKKLSSFRDERLPNETGGVLLGILDTNTRCCSIVDALPSPHDSMEWPTSYIRGCYELPAKVKGAETATAGNVTYVGEWHSHPKPAEPVPRA